MVDTQSRATTLEPSSAFPRLLRAWRQKRRLSQLDLALNSGVSQRHVSFLESGRANPSRSMILQLTETLEVPLRERNQWLLAAGFAPSFRSRALDDPDMSIVMSAVRQMLDNHEPFPAVVIDHMWDILLSNRAFDRMFALVGDGLWERAGCAKGQRNLMRAFFHPDGLRAGITNWTAIAPLLWHRVRREADAAGGAGLSAMIDELALLQDAFVLRAPEHVALVPVLPVEIQQGDTRISLFTVISTFGTAQDVTADEIRVEAYFPGNPETDALFRALATAPGLAISP